MGKSAAEKAAEDQQHVIDAIKSHAWCPEVVISEDETSAWMWNEASGDTFDKPKLHMRSDLNMQAIQSLLQNRVLYVFDFEDAPDGSANKWRVLRISKYSQVTS